MTPRKKLEGIKGLSEAKVDKILDAAGKLSSTSRLSTASDVLERRKRIMRITTGSAEFDKLLGGGIETCSITEAYGEFRTGKSQVSPRATSCAARCAAPAKALRLTQLFCATLQLAHTLCVTTQMAPDQGGANGKVMLVDTEGAFRPERLVEIAQRFNLDANAVLENVTYVRAFTSDLQISTLAGVAAKLAEDGGLYKMLIVDSATALFRVDYVGRGELAPRQQALNQYLSKLMKMAEEFNIAVFITNQVMSTPDGAAASFVVDPKKPVGGHVLAHASTTRLFFRKGRGEQRICKIVDSPTMPEGDATFQIAPGGITDAID